MAFVFVLLGLGLALLSLYLKSPKVIGAAGERRVNRALRSKLPEAEYITLDNLTLPTADGTTQIDHVVLSRYGIFVIETKNMSGWIFGSESQARWTQVVHRHKSQFQNPLRQNFHHVKVLQELLGIRQDQLENLVVFTGSARAKTAMPANVFWKRAHLMAHIAAQRTIHFSQTEVVSFAETLRRRALEDNRATRRAHVDHVREKASAKTRAKPTPAAAPRLAGSEPGSCPRCGSALVKRSNKKTGESFYGCSNFPRCRGTVQVTTRA